jgi:Xaa-Pro aminopeptidase
VIVCLPDDRSGADSDTLQAIYGVPKSHLAAAIDTVVASDTPAEGSGETEASGVEPTVATRDPETPPGTHGVSILADHLGDAPGTGTLQVASHLPHDAAVRLQQAGYDISSTPALAEARASKTPAERECLRAAQQAGAHGVASGAAQLDAATTNGERLYAGGEPLSASRLKRSIASAVAETGVTPARVAVHAEATDHGDPLPAGEGIIIEVRPRGPHGYHGHLTRTVVADSDGGWDRRAHIAATAGLTAARAHCDPETSVATVAAEVRAELTAYGFPPLTNPGEADDETDSLPEAGSTTTVHGVGLAPVEAPSPREPLPLDAGSVLAVECGVVDPDHGRLRLGSLVAVTDDGGDQLVDHSVSLTPESAAE